MGLRSFLKAHEVKEDKNAIVSEDEEGNTSIDIGNAIKLVKELKNRKS